ncbi:MAG: TetR/AcrR family transcriptional regulator [Clostridiales Family XIII bacterium]|jgi:AcrR family transcriptional regulator|nr:TetR/AcrR family transcriptional regulator [Clostridiales Family XIII bacterium]
MAVGKVNSVGMKRRILDAAVKLFSESSFAAVSVRDIADAVGIKASSIYSHYGSKQDLLDAIYAHYEEVADRVRPDLGELMLLAETADPFEALARTEFHFDPDEQETMDRIVIIAAVESRWDERSEDFIMRNVVNLPKIYAEPLLKRMLELERIEPFDIDVFIVLMSNFCLSAALRNFSRKRMSFEEWALGYNYLLRMVAPTGK